MQGYPSSDIPLYKNHLISYFYASALENYEGTEDDTTYYWSLTVGSDIFDDTDFLKDYGHRTATGVTDISMMGAKTAMPIRPI